MVVVNLVTMWLWWMGLWMNNFHLDICVVRITEKWGWLCWQWSWIVESNLFWHFDLLLRAKRHRLLLTNLGWHLNIDMMTWHEDVLWQILTNFDKFSTNFSPILTNFPPFIPLYHHHLLALPISCGWLARFFLHLFSNMVTNLQVTGWQTYK